MESGFIKLVNNSNSDSFRHIIIILNDDIALKGRIKNPFVKIHVFRMGSVFKNIKNLYRLIKMEKIDILHARGWPTMLEATMVGLILSNLKTIFSFHGRINDELIQINWKRKITQVALARCFSKIITLTESMRDELSKEFILPKSKIKIIHNCVSIYQYSIDIRRKKRREFRIPEDVMVVGYVGRLDPVKRLDIIMEAFDLYYEKYQKGYLFIVGEGEMNSELKALARRRKSSDRIVFTGFRDDVPDVMRIFDIYVQASIYEGLSNTILEAMSIGLPIVCTKVGGNIDLVQQGINGYLINRDDLAGMAKYLAALTEDKETRESMAKANKDKIINQYSISKMTRAYESMYAELVAKLRLPGSKLSRAGKPTS